ncbi:unnamed protein product [Lactuca saligna]|uniref:3-hydroxyacyl-CoA dehydrogenase NAD binding domain-containing protein n=1 Tax=Lactuca saligna TaxID=75948 RepID=A0AA35Y3E7_LACSI|nr:unnamed protein product [Lactuca saligna]
MPGGTRRVRRILVVSSEDPMEISEVEALNELRQTETCKSLVHIFFALYNTSKISGITDMGLQPRKVNRVGVIGPGSIAIATTFILANIHVIFKEDDENSLEATLGEIKANFHNLLMAGKMTKEKLERIVSLLKDTLVVVCTWGLTYFEIFTQHKHRGINRQEKVSLGKELRMLSRAARDAGALREAKDKLEK